MTAWRDATFAVVDVETTGLDADRHEVLSIGIVDVVEGRVRVGSAYYREVRPRVLPDAATVVIHGIRPSDAAVADDARDVGREVVERLRDRVLVAHVAWVERGFLARWLGPFGYSVPRHVVDTDVLARLALARAGGPVTGDHLGLGAAAAAFGVPEHRRHHALGDAMTTAQLFVAAASRLEDGRSSVRALERAGRRLTLARAGRALRPRA